MSAVDLDQVKLALDLTGDDGHDDELRRLLTAAEAEYLEHVGPLDALPANDAETIITDVAEFWIMTQRDDGGGRAGFKGEGAAAVGRPVQMWPRIRRLARIRRQPVGSFPEPQEWPCW